MGYSADPPGCASTQALRERRGLGPAVPGARERIGSDGGLDNWIAASWPMEAKEKVHTLAGLWPIMILSSPVGRRMMMLGSKYHLMAKKAKHSDAVMTGILVTKFKMGQINIEDLERMAVDPSRAERCSATKKVLVVRDQPDPNHYATAL